MKNSDEVLSADLVAALLDATQPVTPPPALKQKIMMRARFAMPAAKPITLMQHEGWLPLSPLLSIKILFVDDSADSVSFLLKAAPGGAVPEHKHTNYEECLILEGQVKIGPLTLGPGEYHCVSSAQEHPVISTDTGALVYLRTSIRDCPIPL